MLFSSKHKSSLHISKAILYLNDIMGLSDYTRTEYLEEISSALYNSLESYQQLPYTSHPTDIDDDYRIYVIVSKLLYKTKASLERASTEDLAEEQRLFLCDHINRINIIHTKIKQRLEEMSEEWTGS